MYISSTQACAITMSAMSLCKTNTIGVQSYCEEGRKTKVIIERTSSSCTIIGDTQIQVDGKREMTETVIERIGNTNNLVQSPTHAAIDWTELAKVILEEELDSEWRKER